MPGIRSIAFDGDDTLWHNEDVFRSVESRFQSLVSRYTGGADVGDRLFATETKNLQRYGYGAKSFILSMMETALDVSNGKLSGGELRSMLSFLSEILDDPTRLLSGVRETIEHLASDHRLILLTKGDLVHQERRIARSGLAGCFDHVRIVSEKDPQAYRELLRDSQTPAREFAMVGNSVRSDVLPAIAAGMYAIHVPYHVTWKHEDAGTQAIASDRYRRAASITEVPEILKCFRAHDRTFTPSPAEQGPSPTTAALPGSC